MSKVKVRCTSCGKWFQSANAKDTTCPTCVQKAKREKQAAKATPVAGPKPVVNRPIQAPPRPKQEKSGTSQWLDSVSDVKVGQPEQLTRPKLPPSPPRDTRGTFGSPRDTRETNTPTPYRERDSLTRTPGGPRTNDSRPTHYRVGGGDGLPAKPRQPMDSRGPRPGGDFRPDRGNRASFNKNGKPAGRQKVKTPKPPPAPRPKREKIPPPQPFVPTPEQITQVQTRYLELAQPEFDGIRTQIAQELSIPKKTVKQIVKELRESQQIPSWWDNETYKGSEEDLARVRELYEPTLPLPDIGVHKKIAEQLSLKPVTVYQAIKTIRAEMHLPQYNDPGLHGLDLKPRTSKQPREETQNVQDSQEALPAQEPVPVPTDDVNSTDTAQVVAHADAATPEATTNAGADIVAESAHTEATTPVPTADAGTSDTGAVLEQVATSEQHEDTQASQVVASPESQQSVGTEA